MFIVIFKIIQFVYNKVSEGGLYMLIFGILCICLSLDVFVCALEQGATIRNIRFSKALVYGLIFALCSSGMFLLGHGMSTYIFGRHWQH